MNAILRCSAFVLLATVPLARPADAAEPEFARSLDIDLDFALADMNDNSLRWSMGREETTKVPYAIVALHGEASKHVSYRIELNGVNDSMRPQPFNPSDKTPFFFPNRVEPGYGIVSHPEGQYMVDDYKSTGWDPYLVEHNLRRAYVDVHWMEGRFGLVVGRFFPPLGFPIDETRWLTSRDLTHIQLINTEVDAGLSAYYKFGKPETWHGEVSATGMTGNGNPYHDYVYFDFTRATFEDTNSAKAFVLSGRVTPMVGLDIATSFQWNYVGSRIEGDTTVQRSKHYDNRFVGGFRYRPSFFKPLQVFGEYARYKWGLRGSSAELFPGVELTSPIMKDGYYVGADLGLPLPGKKGTAGVTVTREELDRDDSVVDVLAARGLYGVTRGEKERGTIVRLYAELGPLMVFAFYNDLDNPFPQASAIQPISGPFAFQGPGDRKKGIGVRFRANVFSVFSSKKD